LLSTNGTRECWPSTASPPSWSQGLRGRPNIIDAVMNREVALVINTPAGRYSAQDDSFIRKAAVKYKVPYITTLTAALAAAKGIDAWRTSRGAVRALQTYHSGIH